MGKSATPVTASVSCRFLRSAPVAPAVTQLCLVSLPVARNVVAYEAQARRVSANAFTKS